MISDTILDPISLQDYATREWPRQRQFDRAKLEVRAEIEVGAQRYRGWTLNIGEGGCAVTMPASIPCGAEIRATIMLNGGHEISFKAVVRHGNGFVYGCEFLAIYPEDRVAVRNFVRSPGRRPRSAA